ncbi:hypothetical protein NEMBOFW57_001809 [Staphylotrichum longicolle]|uniref:Stress-response A/B barrel domain-containing protein n=1 Tax=Staphylotrichum longicolle TaxID=669026 RepID=A0AAD4F2T5_9PEZI|nr:hypothetical protein NEMBOFW57_001809 [Staphylotrichum longicolle]
MGVIFRSTLFKAPDAESQARLLEAYSTLKQNQVKDGKPYIIGVEARLLLDDPRSNGYTVVARTLFSSVEDMKYYDTECPAHKELRKTASGLIAERPLVVAVESEATEAMLALLG